eukprot:CAMPEP_0196776246 /NCGR_PEP_ID=MMETSP1104-20130614/4510_1 /TAXON_ID=33652 /ORGANISM="Cafeteria sp., Strain Caron Lab Isolate" /LENGTH=520 /DNA_ID=CAMNT_0042146417 /DNA_START=35 /DNA_END=1597 /DNA_ORIENTATION=+
MSSEESKASKQPVKRARVGSGPEIASNGAKKQRKMEDAGGSSSSKGAASSSSTSHLVDRSRVRILREGEIRGTGPVVYWMSRDQRARDNWALLYAQERALQQSAPLAVVFNLVPKFLDATIRQFGFMLRGLSEVEARLAEHNIPLFLLQGSPETNVPAFVRENGASLLVADFTPLRISLQWHRAVADAIDVPFHQVDAHNVVPAWVASDRLEYAARTIRPRITKWLPKFLVDFPSLQRHPAPWPGAKPENDWDKARAGLEVNRDVPEVAWCAPGEDAGLAQLRDFATNRIKLYEAQRNNPCVPEALSNLSPWLHFGQLSAQRAALEVKCIAGKSHSGAVASFIEESIVRRELAENYCFFNPDGYDRLDGLYPQYDNNSWAQKTLREHAGDKREVVYTAEQLEKGRTHDELWNASQLEMVHTGKMHGFLRMYWAKKILEWTPSPGEALRIAIYLNDKYELDGRDPNGYVGCAWAIAGVHDQGWAERAVFGKIRYMNLAGCKRKFNVANYISRIKRIVQALR